MSKKSTKGKSIQPGKHSGEEKNVSRKTVSKSTKSGQFVDTRHLRVAGRAGGAGTEGSWVGNDPRPPRDVDSRSTSLRSADQPAGPRGKSLDSKHREPRPASKGASSPSLLDLIKEMKAGDTQDQERTYEALKHVERTRI